MASSADMGVMVLGLVTVTWGKSMALFFRLSRPKLVVAAHRERSAVPVFDTCAMHVQAGAAVFAIFVCERAVEGWGARRTAECASTC